MNRIRDTFNKLVQNHFLKRAPSIDNQEETTEKNGSIQNGTKSDKKKERVPKFLKNDTFTYVAPDIRINGLFY